MSTFIKKIINAPIPEILNALSLSELMPTYAMSLQQVPRATPQVAPAMPQVAYEIIRSEEVQDYYKM